MINVTDWKDLGDKFSCQNSPNFGNYLSHFEKSYLLSKHLFWQLMEKLGFLYSNTSLGYPALPGMIQNRYLKVLKFLSLVW